MESIGKYQVQRVLGRGGMGTVYEALDPVLHRKVALKTMIAGLADSPDLHARFLREAQAAGRLRHRNIVTVYDLGEDKGQPYIAMEFIDGTDLEKIIQNREPFSVEWKLDVLRQICEGLAYAHRNGIVHRDIKPANIRVTPEAEVKIMDFGIAHLQSSTMTKSGLVLGTIHYMAPEQVDGKKVDHRADIFAVGAIAYELIAYKRPFEGESLTNVMYKIMNEPADMQALPRSDYSPGLERIVEKALARRVDDRYQSLEQMHDDLEKLVRDTAPKLMGRQGAAVALLTGAREERAAGNLEQAVRLAQEAQRLAPDQPEAAAFLGEVEGERRSAAGKFLGQARVALASKKALAAREWARKAQALTPEDADVQGVIRQAEDEAMKVEQEIAEVRTEVDRARGEGQLQKALSLCKRLIELGDPDGSRLAAEIDAAIKDREVEQLCGMALSYAADGDMELALKIAGKIERLAPESPRYKELKDYLDYETARQDAEALTATAQEHLAHGNLEEAIAAAEEALAIHASDTVAKEIRDRATAILAQRQKTEAPPPPPPPPAPAPPPPPPPPPPAPAPAPAAAKPAPAPAKPAAPAPAPAPAPAKPAPAPAAAAPAKGRGKGEPKPEPAKAEAPKPEPPKAEPPKPEPPKAEQPRPEPPKVEAPRPAPAPTPAPAPAAPEPKPEPVAAAPAAPRVDRGADAKLAAALGDLGKKPAAPKAAAPAAGGAMDDVTRRAEAQALLLTAESHMLAGNLAKAKKALEKLLAVDPNNKKAKELMKTVP